MAPLQTLPPIWSKQYNISSDTARALPGDKICLPPSALEQLLTAYSKVNTEESHTSSPAYDSLNSTSFGAFRRTEYDFADRNQQLPHPLTFKLVNPSNGRTVFAGVREFSAEEDEIVLSRFLRHTLAYDGSSGTSITIHAQQLPKGTFVKLRPLEAGYDPADWKALLEQHLRASYTTLTNGEILSVSNGRAGHGAKEEFRFLVDGFKPESDGICVVDTDLEVDIEALNEEQARETLRQIAEKLRTAPGTDSGSSSGGAIDIFKAQQGQVVPGEYVDYELASWDRSQTLFLELDVLEDAETIDLFVSPLAPTQRSRPRLDEHVFADLEGRPAKRIRLDPSNASLDDAEALYVSVQAYQQSDAHHATTPISYTLRATHAQPSTYEQLGSHSSADDVQCGNCKQWIPKQRLVLHENFCLRNNVLCQHGCGQVFQRRSVDFESHWHCPYDEAYGNTQPGLQKHNKQMHLEEVLRCVGCDTQETFPSWPALAAHHITNCPAKLILCRFCHLEVPQEGDPDIPSAEVLLSGMTQHELLDGARTTECHMCSKIVRLRDMDTHLKSHNLDRFSRPIPQPCRNVNCGRTLDTVSKTGDTRAGTRMGQGAGNDIGLCNVCFGPLYNSMHDPENKALKRRIERRYLQQLLTGCGKSWCKNEFCKTARTSAGQTTPSSTKDALPLIKTPVDKSVVPPSDSPLHFCVDEGSQRRRILAQLLAAEGDAGRGGYAFPWCVGALEAETGDLDAARQWLKNWAPQTQEARS